MVRKAATTRAPKAKEKKGVVQGVAHIKSTFNNTIVSITDMTGAVVSWSSAGQVGFKGTKKSTPFAAHARRGSGGEAGHGARDEARGCLREGSWLG